MSEDPCQPIRDRIDESEKIIRDLEEFLPEAPPFERPRIKEKIKREKQKLSRLQRELTACENAEKAS